MGVKQRLHSLSAIERPLKGKQRLEWIVIIRHRGSPVERLRHPQHDTRAYRASGDQYQIGAGVVPYFSPRIACRLPARGKAQGVGSFRTLAAACRRPGARRDAAVSTSGSNMNMVLTIRSLRSSIRGEKRP
jgi:hypothetical protein